MFENNLTTHHVFIDAVLQFNSSQHEENDILQTSGEGKY